MTEILIRCVPRRCYWFIGILLYPVASFVFTAVLVRPLFLLVGSDLARGGFILTWLGVTAVVGGCAYVHDYRRLHYVLFSDSLCLGRGASTVRIPFDEIQSVVLALPERMSWILRIQRFNPKGREVYRNAVRARKLTILLRLSGGRYLPLNLAYSFLESGQIFMAEFLRRKRSKIVGHDSYTEREIEALASARSNTIKTL